jgi:protein-glutamine gamma-glutamyltransferase
LRWRGRRRGIWVLATGGILLNAWLVKTGRFTPMPRLMANVVTTLGLVILALAVRRGGTTPILLVGQFLVLLHLIKLFEQRANRDYAQLLVLSLLLMVAASISTASLAFGFLLVVYLFLSLYCCLLFHLKVETDHARQAIGIPADKINPATLRQDQRYLSRSMRRLTVLVSLFAVATAVLTFLMFPRSNSSSVLGPLQWRPSQALTGFAESVNFQNIARITQNNTVVAYVTVTRFGEPYRSGWPLLLRGVTLNRYSGGDASEGSLYQWTRYVPPSRTEDFRADDWHDLRQPVNDEEQAIRQEVMLQPTGTSTLFAIGGITRFRPKEGGQFRYCRQDEVLQSVQPLIQPLQYEVDSAAQVTRDLTREDEFVTTASARATRPKIDPEIEQFARRPEVSGGDAQGALAAQRDPEMPVSPLDIAIAQNFESYLRKNFTYTLDLTDARRIADRDPMVAFLYDLKRGHCEYFAGAMTLMCQSLGMQARMVVGFKCDEYNTIGGYYAVRQSHAHAWVEVLGEDGVWHTFDPTSGREAPARPRETLWAKAKSLFNYLEYTWASSVVAYDRESRTNVISKVGQVMDETAVEGSDKANKALDWLNDKRSLISSGLISILIVLMMCMMVAAVAWYLWEQWKLRRRVRRIGLNALPVTEQLRLARRLGFYDDLLRLLERHRIVCPPQLTPLEFSDSLAFLPVEVFDSIRRLTEAFYRVRYGEEDLSPLLRRRLIDAIAHVETSLSGTKI